MSQVLSRSNTNNITDVSLPLCLGSINNVQFTYPLWSEDLREVTSMEFESPNRVPSFVEGMKRKQKLFDGDRSDAALVLLDSIDFTYPQWRDDTHEAELAYIKTPPLAKKRIEAMKRKQELYSCDRTSWELMQLDSLHLTYDAHETDKAEAERLYVEYPTLFKIKLETMRRKQLLYSGGGETPPSNSNNFISMDRRYTYNPWETGSQMAIRMRLEGNQQPSLSEFATRSSSSMEQKQHTSFEHNYRKQISILNSSMFTYSTVDVDRKDAEKLLLNYPLLFEKKLEAMHRKQRIFCGDRSHPQLVAIDSLKFTYHGWEQDFDTTIRCHCEFPAIFDAKLKAMTNKQEAHNVQVIRDQLEQQADQTSILKDRGTCIICLERSSTYAYVPCGHLCICETCTTVENVDNKCPVCRTFSLQLMKVFVT